MGERGWEQSVGGYACYRLEIDVGKRHTGGNGTEQQGYSRVRKGAHGQCKLSFETLKDKEKEKRKIDQKKGGKKR